MSHHATCFMCLTGEGKAATVADDPSSSDPPAAVDEKVPSEKTTIMNMFNYWLYVGKYFIHILSIELYWIYWRVLRNKITQPLLICRPVRQLLYLNSNEWPRTWGPETITWDFNVVRKRARNWLEAAAKVPFWAARGLQGLQWPGADVQTLMLCWFDWVPELEWATGNHQISWQILVAWIPLGFILFSRLFSEKHSIGESCLRGQIQYFSAGCFLPHLECWSCPYKKRTERLCLQRCVNGQIFDFQKEETQEVFPCVEFDLAGQGCVTLTSPSDPREEHRTLLQCARSHDWNSDLREIHFQLGLSARSRRSAVRGTATFSSSFAVPWIEPPNLWTQIVWVWKPSWRKVAATFGLWRLGQYKDEQLMDVCFQALPGVCPSIADVGQRIRIPSLFAKHRQVPVGRKPEISRTVASRQVPRSSVGRIIFKFHVAGVHWTHIDNFEDFDESGPWYLHKSSQRERSGKSRPFKKISDLIWLDTMGPCITLHTFLSNHHQSISIIIFRYTQSLADLVGM